MRRLAVAALLVLALACSAGAPPGAEPQVPDGLAATDEATPATTAVENPVDVIRRAVEHTSELRTVHMTFEQQMSFTDAPQMLTRGSGRIDIAGNAGRVFLDLPNVPGDTKTPDSMQVIWKGAVMYFEGLPDIPKETPWVRMDTRQMDGVPGLESIRDAMSQGTADFGMLYGAQDVEIVGPDELDGVETTRYALTTDFATATREIPPDQRKSLERYLRKFTTDSLEMDVWIDSEDQLRRLEFVVEEGGVAGRLGKVLERLVTVVDFVKFDAPVRLELPPKRQVLDLTDAIRGEAGAGDA